MSIASEIARLQGAKADIKTAIEAKGVTVPSDATLDGYGDYIEQISGGGGTDFDDWVKDGDTHLWIKIVSPYQKEQQLRIRMIGTIDWGDGTIQSVSVTSYTTFTHTYSDTGKYRIDLHPTSGTFYLGGNSSSYNVMGARSTASYIRTSVLYQAEVGTSIITTLSNYAFAYCLGLLRVFIPETIKTLGTYIFYFCRAVKEIIFEDASKITSTSCNGIFYGCYCLQSIETFEKWAGTELNQTIRDCYCLAEFTVPAGTTSVAANTFNSAYGLQKMHCLPTTPPSVANSNAFTSFSADCIIEVPSASLASYQSASGWSGVSSQMIGV